MILGIVVPGPTHEGAKLLGIPMQQAVVASALCAVKSVKNTIWIRTPVLYPATIVPKKDPK